MLINSACAVLIILCGLYCGDANMECYYCIGKKGPGVDPCYRTAGVSSQPKVSCKGPCAKFSFWINDMEQGYVRRVCSDGFNTCEEIGDPVMRMADDIPVTPIQKLSLKYKCDYCNTTLCNNANLIYPSLLSLLIMCIVVLVSY